MGCTSSKTKQDLLKEIQVKEMNIKTIQGKIASLRADITILDAEERREALIGKE